jgi:hypothetical protein
MDIKNDTGRTTSTEAFVEAWNRPVVDRLTWISKNLKKVIRRGFRHKKVISRLDQQPDPQSHLLLRTTGGNASSREDVAALTLPAGKTSRL